MALSGRCGNVCCLAGRDKAHAPDRAGLPANRLPGCTAKLPGERAGGKAGSPDMPGQPLGIRRSRCISLIHLLGTNFEQSCPPSLPCRSGSTVVAGRV